MQLWWLELVVGTHLAMVAAVSAYVVAGTGCKHTPSDEVQATSKDQGQLRVHRQLGAGALGVSIH